MHWLCKYLFKFLANPVWQLTVLHSTSKVKDKGGWGGGVYSKHSYQLWRPSPSQLPSTLVVQKLRGKPAHERAKNVQLIIARTERSWVALELCSDCDDRTSVFADRKWTQTTGQEVIISRADNKRANYQLDRKWELVKLTGSTVASADRKWKSVELSSSNRVNFVSTNPEVSFHNRGQ